jgi:hypothetical protein
MNKNAAKSRRAAYATLALLGLLIAWPGRVAATGKQGGGEPTQDTPKKPFVLQPVYRRVPTRAERLKMTAKYRAPGADRSPRDWTWHGNAGSLKVTLWGQEHQALLESIVKDSALPVKGGAQDAKLEIKHGRSTLEVRGENADVRRVEQLVRERTYSVGGDTDHVVDHDLKR